MNTMLMISAIVLIAWFMVLCVGIYMASDIEVYNVGNSIEFGGGIKFIPRTRCRDHKLAYACCPGPDGLWELGDLLIYSKKFDSFRRCHHYLFRKYEHKDLDPFYPTVVIFKCTEGVNCNCRRPKFERQLGSEWECIGELRGVQVNGKNIMF